MRLIGSCFAPLLLFLAYVSAAGGNAADRFSGVPTAVQPFVDRGEISGAVMLVGTKDRVLHWSAVGASEVVSGRRMRTDDLFWIASMSKPITAAAVALLVDDGRLALDDPVAKYVPEFGQRWLQQDATAERRGRVRPARAITVRDLLTHTSGLGEYEATGPHWTLAEMTRALAREALRFEPGSRWGYSTAGTDLLGRVVEVASGVRFDEFVQRRLFDPLGMKDTTFWPTAAQLERLAHDYRLNPLTGKLEPVTIAYLYGGAIPDRARPPLGGAGLFSTADDVLKFYQMMLNGGAANGRQILRPATVAAMTRKQTGELKARPGMPWGLGFCVIEDPTQMEANVTLSPGTFGHGGAHGTNSWADPVRGLVYVFMIQRDKLQPNPDNSAMRRAYQDAVAAALAKP